MDAKPMRVVARLKSGAKAMFNVTGEDMTLEQIRAAVLESIPDAVVILIQVK
jgi:hypothetical protein